MILSCRYRHFIGRCFHLQPSEKDVWQEEGCNCVKPISAAELVDQLWCSHHIDMSDSLVGSMCVSEKMSVRGMLSDLCMCVQLKDTLLSPGFDTVYLVSYFECAV